MNNDLTIPLPKVPGETSDAYRRRVVPRYEQMLRATMQRKEHILDVLGDLHALYAGTDRTLDHEEVCGRVQELLYGDNHNEYPKTPNNEGELS